MTIEVAEPSRVKALAAWLHEQRIGCDREPNDSVDIGLGFHHTGDHSADASALLAILDAEANR